MPDRTTVKVELWREYDPRAKDLPGMYLGAQTIDGSWGAAAERLHREGVACVRIAEPVDACRTGTVHAARTLVLIRELTARGTAVEWEVRCGDGCVADHRYDHLYPPARVLGQPDAVLAVWRDTFFPAKCIYRHGPGFMQVRDRRSGGLELFSIDDPRHLAAIETAAEGAPTNLVPPDVRGEFTAAGLLAESAGHVWWLPARVRRWPFPAFLV
jgi:Family of unknown function (DUF5825)